MRTMRVLPVCLALILLAPVAPAVAASCSQIKAHYHSSVKPRMTAAATGNPTVAMQFRTRLGQMQQGRYPRRGEINRAYRLLMRDCAGRSDTRACRASASRLRSAALGVYAENRRWVRAGCPGVLAAR